MAAGQEFIPFMLEMFKNPPDRNAPLPLGNRPSTVYGVTMPFHVLSLLAVIFRLHIRFRVVREPGLDDLWIVVAAIMKLVGLAAFFGGLDEGIGKHIIFHLDILQKTMIWFYIANSAYVTAAVCVKLSLLSQYLRIFRDGYRRRISLVLMILVSVWGAVFIFMAWFPCFPVSGYWDKSMSPPAKCYGFGYRTLPEAKNTLFAFSGSNMIFDVAVFLVPLTEYFRPGLKRKQILAMTGLFAFGSIVLLFAILRLWSGLKYNNTLVMYDFTWWISEVLIFSCLEIDFAIMCASMPIFWPSVKAAWTRIYVTQEVTVVHDRRSHFIDPRTVQMELSQRKSHESTCSLTKTTMQEASDEGPFYTSFDPETGRGPGSGIAQVEVQPSEQPVRWL
ncbi:hypothetical protein HBI56_172300 [Parastagonospora nodorum]|uniref:Rhodopsin domain-containing protein n=2 Tax=Phaeosphaeria nodorum (strain SN15 / ATCC MYA-4574 / FGSC 10173) TaxID=321614 RepID=A0A7U2HZ09_PHANO|nr:hypothetical protein SNOG_13984 [Parastagonospora nodorum SN15]KAH3905168.1 hypothetical protein HBH56_221030 [Parastagonospora nodorum]EAT78609.1 hypothetical protein SNOG_13984 [Parastagonospora nodorum SN15]KAH3924058.1 hypothetical protein HBH54_200710 [Parastagonospora nodorum]KAH3944523.1 hypothetical protein HBH53_157080 [Parastagonospora nodorum]KAH3963513.1 hypothetical protein HBH51_167610 [Parastagonospora nodorum]